MQEFCRHIWLSTQDKEFHKPQISSKGKVGYISIALVSIHPGKKVQLLSLNYNLKIWDKRGINNVKEEIKSSEKDSIKIEPNRKRYQKTFEATQLVKKGNVSCNIAAKICGILADIKVNINSPSQAGV